MNNYQDAINSLHMAMIKFDHGDARRIQHFTKVYSYASLIGHGEGLDEYQQFILESAALVHDIGIHVSEEKYGYQNGTLQEKEGPAAARKLLSMIPAYTEEAIERICWLVAHHHTYKDIDSTDYQILVEADFIVNLFEDNESGNAIRSVREKIFRTKTGIKLLENMFF